MCDASHESVPCAHAPLDCTDSGASIASHCLRLILRTNPKHITSSLSHYTCSSTSSDGPAALRMRLWPQGYPSNSTKAPGNHGDAVVGQVYLTTERFNRQPTVNTKIFKSETE